MSRPFLSRHPALLQIDTPVQPDHEDLAHSAGPGNMTLPGWNYYYRYYTESCRCPEIYPACKHAHGTMVASIAAGAVSGVAKQAKIVSVPIGGCMESVSLLSSVLSALDSIATYVDAEQPASGVVVIALEAELVGPSGHPSATLLSTLF